MQEKVIQHNSDLVYLILLKGIHHLGLAFAGNFESRETVCLDALRVSEGKVGKFLNALMRRRGIIIGLHGFFLQVGLIEPALKEVEFLQWLKCCPIEVVLMSDALYSGLQEISVPKENEPHCAGSV